jgi:hypothetical protein
MKFLHLNQAIDQLKMGRSIEQWLGHSNAPNYRSIKWLSIDPKTVGTFNLSLFEVFDDGSPEMLDVYSFEPVDPDLTEGMIVVFDTPEDAIASAIEQGGSPDKFVGAGRIQDLYKDFLSDQRTTPRSDMPRT